MQQEVELTPAMAFQYMGELISEYMKTLPVPVRAPVIAMVNQASSVVGQALNDGLKLRTEADEAARKLADEGHEVVDLDSARK